MVHGRMNYRRLAIFTYYMFYINVALVFILYFFSLTAAMSTGAYFLLPVFVNFFAIIYTPLPIIIYGSFDADVPKCGTAPASMHSPPHSQPRNPYHGVTVMSLSRGDCHGLRQAKRFARFASCCCPHSATP